MEEISRKVCLCGDSSVGKTSLIRRFVKGQFDENYISTLGTNMSKKTVKVPKKRCDVKMIIWDISGQSEFKHVHASAFNNAAGMLAVCDVTRPETAENLEQWISTFYKHARNDAPVIVLANKSDLSEKNPECAAEVHDRLKSLDLLTLTTSAKTGQNVEEAFKNLADAIAKDESIVIEEGVRKIELPESFDKPSALLDYVTIRFCDSLDDQEMGMHMVRKQIASQGLDFQNVTNEDVKALFERLESIVTEFKGEKEARKLHADFLKAYNRSRG